MGPAEAGGPEISSDPLGIAAHQPWAQGDCQNCGQCDYCLSLKRRQMWDLPCLDVEEDRDGASPTPPLLSQVLSGA